MAVGAVVLRVVFSQIAADLAQRKHDGQGSSFIEPECLRDAVRVLGQVACIEQRQIAQQGGLAAAGVAQHDQAPMRRQGRVDRDLRGLARRGLVLTALPFARRQCRFVGQPGNLGPLAGVARGTQGHINPIQLDVDEPAAGTDALQLEVTVLTDERLQITAERTLARDRGHRNRCIADDHGGTLLRVNDLAAWCGGEVAAGVDRALVVAGDGQAAGAHGNRVRTLGDGAARRGRGGHRRGRGVEGGLIDRPGVERGSELFQMRRSRSGHDALVAIGGCDRKRWAKPFHRMGRARAMPIIKRRGGRMGIAPALPILRAADPGPEALDSGRRLDWPEPRQRPTSPVFLFFVSLCLCVFVRAISGMGWAVSSSCPTSCVAANRNHG